MGEGRCASSLGNPVLRPKGTPNWRKQIFGEMLSMAQATRRNGGIIIVQVARLTQRGTLLAKQVKIPGMLMDLVVVFSSPFRSS